MFHLGLDRWSVRLCDSETDQVGARKGHFHFCRRGTSTNGGTHERDL